MKRFYDQTLVETYLQQTKFASVMNGLQKHLFVAQYEKGEFVTMPVQKEQLFQIIIEGSVSIYFIRDDGSVYSLANGREDDLLGEMEIFSHQLSNVYAESNADVICLALSIETSKSELMCTQWRRDTLQHQAGPEAYGRAGTARCDSKEVQPPCQSRQYPR